MSDLATIRRFLSLVKQPGELIELRCDQSEGERKTRKHGYYNDHHKAAQDAADFAGNVYFTVNRLDPDLPVTNELVPCRKGCCTKAKDIVRRTLLYLDGDPVRPSGTASTDEQHQAAIDLVRFVAGQLSFPKPIIGSSGNGACAFWKIDLPPDSTLPKRVLKTIKAKWETPAVSIDLTVASAARIGRLLGTDNHKGGKAGRQSTILDAPTIITPAERIEQYGEWVENPEKVEDGALELLTEEAMEAFAPLPKEQTEANRAQQLVTSWTFGKTYEEQVRNVGDLLKAKGIQCTISKSPDSKGTFCKWFHFDCVFRPGQTDARNWIKVHPTGGVTGGCFHGKCAGKGLVEILSVIAPALAAQAAETYDDSHRLARSYLQSRSPLVIWQRCPHSYQDGVYVEDCKESVRAEVNLHIKREFDALGFSETPNVTTKEVNNVFAAVEALTFDRAETTPHWRGKHQYPASEYLVFQNGMLHVPSYLDGSYRFSDFTPNYFTLAKLPYDFDSNAPEPKHFIDYCRFQWDDVQVHLLLEEILGDILLSDPRWRVFYNFLGKPWAGKSTLAEMIEGLVGEQNRSPSIYRTSLRTLAWRGRLGRN